jgi:hypothetical protein
LSTEKPKAEETRDSPSFDPLAIANDGNRRNGIKEATNTKQARDSTHIFLDRRGLIGKGRENRKIALTFF